MLIDARHLPDRSVIEADICVVGSGPAGITLARELSRRSVRVCLIESGGIEQDEASQALAEIPSVGGELVVPSGTRRRRLGGTATVWGAPIPGDRLGVRMRPLDAIDFEKRDWVPHGGWPFGIDELAPYYAQAQRILGLRAGADDSEAWSDVGLHGLPLDPTLARTTIDQYAHRQTIAEHHRRELVESNDVDVVLWANATGVELHPDGKSVESVRLGCLEGNQLSVRASVFVLATGGIENARLLLLSGDVARGGIANEHDVVGRYFMDHIWAPLGTLALAHPRRFSDLAIYDIRSAGRSILSGRLQLSDDAMREEGLLNSGVAVTARLSPEQERAAEVLHLARWRGRQGARPGAGPSKVRSVLRGGPGLAAMVGELAWRQRRFPPTIAVGWSDLMAGGSRIPGFDLQLQLELPPRPENRVVLTEERDALGMQKAGVCYRFDEIERKTILRARVLFAGALAQSGIGTVELPVDQGLALPAASIAHHIGTTRMHESPSMGVVNPDSRVHGIDNLYVTGSSVFPTGGFANPTLTILALALRLAEHLAPPRPVD